MPTLSPPKTPVCSECGRTTKSPLNPLGRAVVRRMAVLGIDMTALKRELDVSQGGLHASLHAGNMTLPMLERVAKALKTTSSALIADSEKKGKR